MAPKIFEIDAIFLFATIRFHNEYIVWCPDALDCEFALLYRCKKISSPYLLILMNKVE